MDTLPNDLHSQPELPTHLSPDLSILPSVEGACDEPVVNMSALDHDLSDVDLSGFQPPQAVMDGHLMEPLAIDTSFDHHSPDGLGISMAPMAPMTTSEIMSDRRNRKTSTSTLKRSSSQPNVRGASQSMETSMSLADKRRNKLGYHRTSIACTHCRRRKIRCLLAPDDPQNRCANCIRLKKSCTFYAVDQQPPIEKRPRNSSKTEKSGAHSADSSPAVVTSLSSNDHYNAYPHLPMSADQFTPVGVPWNNGLVSPLTRAAPMDGRNGSIDFSQAPQPGQWHSPFADNVSISAGHSSPEAGGQQYWARNESPLTPGYSPHLHNGMAGSISEGRSSFTSFAPSRNDSTWSTAPPRSMSIGIVEDLNGYGNKNMFYGQQQTLSSDARRRASEMRPPSLVTSNTSSNASLSDSYLTPLSAPVASPPQHWSINSAWNALPSSAINKSTDYASWYTEPSLAKVQEEEIAPPFGNEQPTMLYAGGEAH